MYWNFIEKAIYEFYSKDIHCKDKHKKKQCLGKVKKTLKQQI